VHPDDYLDELVPEAEAPGQLQWDAVPWGPSASDAWDGALPGGAADAAHQLPEVLADAGAGKSADPAQGGLALDASFQPERQRGTSEPARLDAAAPYKPDAVLSAERSCAAPGFVEWAVLLVAPDAERSERLVARPVPKP
jgi:hypothetical protein